MLKRLSLTLAIAALVFTGCETTKLAQDMLNAVSQGEPLSVETIAAGLKEALEVGTANAVKKTSQSGGFLNNALLHIAVPEELNRVSKTMRKIGLGGMVDDFETKMNTAAEQASAKATPVFISAIKGMTIADAKAILQGGNTAATDYFRTKTEDQLKALYQPVVQKHMRQVGAVKVYDDLMARYNKIPLAPKPKLDLDNYVSDKALDGLFVMLAKEEQKIRENPAARTTALLKQVFAQQ